MATISIQLEATRGNRTLAQAKVEGHNQKTNVMLRVWARLVEQTFQDAQRTKNGVPTDGAILARWWIAEHKPKQSERDEWERSFECACTWLSLDVEIERRRLLAEIDARLAESYLGYVQGYVYVRRAMVLSCAGLPTAIQKQLFLPLVSKKDYDDVAGVDHGDKFAMYDQRDSVAA